MSFTCCLFCQAARQACENVDVLVWKEAEAEAEAEADVKVEFSE